MGRTALQFNLANLSEKMRFEQMVDVAIEQTGLSALEISEAFDDFRLFKDPKGSLVQDFVEFMHSNDIRTDTNARLALAA
jgi:hypothetical protein